MYHIVLVTFKNCNISRFCLTWGPHLYFQALVIFNKINVYILIRSYSLSHQLFLLLYTKPYLLRQVTLYLLCVTLFITEHFPSTKDHFYFISKNKHCGSNEAISFMWLFNPFYIYIYIYIYISVQALNVTYSFVITFYTKQTYGKHIYDVKTINPYIYP